MKAQDLKNSILQLAIQGKLVPQDDNDEPAEVLYAKIQAEKQKLIKEGKIKKDKPFPPITDDEIPFAIPSTWKWVRLKDLGIINPRNNLSDSIEVTFLPMNCIYSDFYKDIDTSNKKKWGEVKSGYTHIAENDVIMAKITPCFENGKSAIAKNLLNGYGAATTEIHVFRRIIELNLNYILVYLKSPFFMDYATKHMTGTAGQKRVPQNIFAEYFFPLPPLAEQKRIVDKIEELDPLVKQYDKAETELSALNDSFPEQLKKSILQYAIQGKLVPQDANDGPAEVLYAKIQAEKQKLTKEGKIKKDKPLPPITDDEIPFTIPSTWKWVRFKDLFNIVSSKRVLQSNWKTEGVPFYRAREIAVLSDYGFVKNELFISEDLFLELSKTYLMPEENDIMVSAVGTIGKPYIVKANDRFYYKDASVLCYKNVSKIIPEYAKLFIESEYFVSQYSKDSRGTTVDTLTIVRANKYIIPLPPIAEQKRIVAKVNELMQYCEKLKV